MAIYLGYKSHESVIIELLVASKKHWCVYAQEKKGGGLLTCFQFSSNRTKPFL